MKTNSSLLIGLWMLVTMQTYAQNQSTGNAPKQTERGINRITGNILDSLTKNPVQFATVALFYESDRSKPVDGTITDEKGKFTLSTLPNGKFVLRISFIGYDDKFVVVPALDNAKIPSR